MPDVRQLYLDTAGVVVALVDEQVVADAWEDDSALPGMTVGALVAHTARALSTVRRYLDAAPPPPEATHLDAAGYLVTVLPDTDRDAPTNRAVAERAVEGATDGHGSVSDRAHDDLTALRRTLPGLAAAHALTVLGGTPMLLDEYLATRLVELVVHADDLRHSVSGLPPAPLPDAAEAVAVRVLAEVARRRSSTAAMVALLARRERAVGATPRAL